MKHKKNKYNTNLHVMFSAGQNQKFQILKFKYDKKSSMFYSLKKTRILKKKLYFRFLLRTRLTPRTPRAWWWSRRIPPTTTSTPTNTFSSSSQTFRGRRAPGSWRTRPSPTYTLSTTSLTSPKRNSRLPSLFQNLNWGRRLPSTLGKRFFFFVLLSWAVNTLRGLTFSPYISCYLLVFGNS